MRSSCEFIAGALLQPDASGAIASELTVPVDRGSFSHLSIVAQLCPTGAACNTDQALATTIDFRAP